MKKEDVISKLNEYKERPIEIGLADEGAMLYSGIEGHWLFVKGDNLIEIKKNVSDGTFGFSTVNQKESPFTITTIGFDTVNYVRSNFGKDHTEISKFVDGLEPVGTDKTIDDIKKEIETDSIYKACSPRGNVNDSSVAPETSYGRFKGTAITTDVNGFPKYMDNFNN